MAKGDGLRPAGGVKKIRNRNKGATSNALEFKKSRGQHILKNPLVIEKIVEKAGVKNTDVVLEIGPGTGNLTEKLLAKAKKVIAVELDSRLVLELQRRLQGSSLGAKLEVIQADVLKVDLPYFDVCVANIPYNISSPLIFKLLSHRPCFRSATLLLQREFAMRLVAKPSEQFYCRLAVNAQLLARVFHIMKVGKNNFKPIPKVESSVVRIEPRNPAPPVNFLEWDGMTKLCFERKNRTLGAIFGIKTTLRALEVNFRAYQALQNGVQSGQGYSVPSAISDYSIDQLDINKIFSRCDIEDVIGDEDNMDEDATEEPGGKEAIGNFKNLVSRVLAENGFLKKRAVKMDQEELLHLLACFNSVGIHFV